jgi:hypothetical protein
MDPPDGVLVVGGQNALAHLLGQLNAVFFHRLVIILDWPQICPDLIWDFELAKVSHFLKTTVILNGQNAGDDGTRNATVTAVIHKGNQGFRVVKKLRYNKICTSLHLFAQKPNPLFLVI